ncbi:MAG: penicillin-binding protein 2, partial [candidate division WS1 bacterium]|nr:penicillin-binding protein 2 [candidate division WS1 bacterium]
IARLTATIANGGEVIQPCMVDYVETVGNRRTTSGRGEQLGRAVSAQTATTVAGMMRAVVEQGTGAVAGIGGLRAAAKTGSAQHPSGDPHAWFTCFAPYDAPELVVTVIVENGGSGAETAGPIAVEVLRAALSDRIR